MLGALIMIQKSQKNASQRGNHHSTKTLKKLSNLLQSETTYNPICISLTFKKF